MMTHVLRYLLIHGDRKKKVELEVAQGVDNIEVETLRHRARELFGLHAVLLQIWDKGFEDWVDLDDGDATPTNSRIKVELDKNAKVTPVAHHQKTSAAVVSVTEPAGQHAAPSKTREDLSQHRPLAVSSMPQVHTLSVASGQMLRPTVSAVQQLHALCQSHLPQPASSSAQEPYLIEDPPEVVTNVPVHSPSKQVATSSATAHHCHGLQSSSYHEVPHSHTSGNQIISLLQTDPIRTRSTRSNNNSQSMSRPAISKVVSLSNDDNSREPSATGTWIQDSKPLAEDWRQDHLLDQAASPSGSLEGSLTSFLEKRSDSRWIYSYKLPEFPQGAAAKLRAGLTLTNGERSHLMDCVYKSVTPYTFYPTAYEYRFLTEMFLDVFPELYNQAGPSESRENQIDTWKQRLMNKFKNNRKRQDRDIPVVRLHKRVRMNLDPSSHMGHGYDVIDVEEVDDEVEDVADEVAKEHGVVIKQEDCDLDDVYHVMPADTTEFSETGS
ncbi:uncharacterized protein [Diadema setosum]|uniref:uncharacterized protein n=1 Tax=Diadema setosum TaxID=31175 RepID=UPI003B3B6616